MNMAKTPQRRQAAPKANVPDGFEPLTGSRVSGFFLCKAGNSVQGVLRDIFQTKGKFGKKNVFKIEITGGQTTILSEDVEEIAEEGALIGLDEHGWLKRLADVDKGTEIFVKCLGKDEPTEEFPRGVWRFSLGTKKLPF
jgi:hypothetical protein